VFKSRRPDHERFTVDRSRLIVRSSPLQISDRTHRPMSCLRRYLLLERVNGSHWSNCSNPCQPPRTRDNRELRTANRELGTVNPFRLQRPLTLASLAFLETSGRSTAW
jgi:hypothetical protein